MEKAIMVAAIQASFLHTSAIARSFSSIQRTSFTLEAYAKARRNEPWCRPALAALHLVASR
ncbi:hypothetical protein ACFOPN_03260 [Xanthomonas hyacinthi]|uniref:hypothetical protein n=1 Tax=Xanthomonas hyacinthi TaxID=56455 RepID=UPI0036184EFD